MNRPAALVVACAALSISAGAHAQSAPAPTDRELAPLAVVTGTRLDIVAEGEVTRTPDIATISAGVVTQAPTAAAALSDNARRMAAATAALRRAGVGDRDLRTATLSLQPQYRYGENRAPELTGYQASNQLSVRFRDVARAGPILDTLVAQGINQISGPDFSVDQPEAALDEARTEAVAIARRRAEVYAKAAGLRVARMLSISEGRSSEPPVRPMMMARAVAEAADTTIAPGEQALTVTLTVSFELR